MSNNIDWAFAALAKFISENPFGEITFIIQNGKAVNAKKIISEKPPIDSEKGKA